MPVASVHSCSIGNCSISSPRQCGLHGVNSWSQVFNLVYSCFREKRIRCFREKRRQNMAQPSKIPVNPSEQASPPLPPRKRRALLETPTSPPSPAATLEVEKRRALLETPPSPPSPAAIQELLMLEWMQNHLKIMMTRY